MTDSELECPCCGSDDIYDDRIFSICHACSCHWHESRRAPRPAQPADGRDAELPVRPAERYGRPMVPSPTPQPDVAQCKHDYRLDEEAVQHECCQKCGHVRDLRSMPSNCVRGDDRAQPDVAQAVDECANCGGAVQTICGCSTCGLAYSEQPPTDASELEALREALQCIADDYANHPKSYDLAADMAAVANAALARLAPVKS